MFYSTAQLRVRTSGIRIAGQLDGRRNLMLILIILLVLLFSGGGFYGYRSGYYGSGGMGLISILVIVLLVFLVMGGGFGHGMYFR